MRPDRPGVGVIPLPEAPSRDASTWLQAQVRADGQDPDFTSSIPGADMDGLYGIHAAGEPLKLLARFFALLDAEPGRVERRGVAEDGTPPRERDQERPELPGDSGDVTSPAEPGPVPSAIPYTFIRE